MIGTTSTIALGIWLIDKIKDKGFDTIFSKITEADEVTVAFNKAVSQTSKSLHIKYPEVLAGKIEYFFKNETVFKELIKLLFINSIVNLDVISKNFDTETLPPNFIFEFVKALKEEVLKDKLLSKIIYNKELFILVYGISTDVEVIAENSNIATNEIIKIKNIIEERIGNKFNYDNFLKIYSENAVNNLSQVNFIGLGVGADISKKNQ